MSDSQARENSNVFLDPAKNEEYFKNRVGMGESYDLGVRKVSILGHEDPALLSKWIVRHSNTSFTVKRELVAI